MSLATVHEQIVACDRCPRLRTYCARIARDKKAAHRDDEYWGRPVPGFGDPQARLLILGLAPAAHGANRTGRVFTGDGSGDFLMRAMHRTGFANIATSRRADDGLALRDAYIAAAVRCAPPDNKPTPDELRMCQTHLEAEIAALTRLQVVMALGKIAFDTWWRLMVTHPVIVGPSPDAPARVAEALRQRPRPVFGHGATFIVDGAPAVIASYHPSRQNTNTGKLTPAMLEAVFRHAKRLLMEG
jgi:uracil-DNA glycosylase family 4